MSSTDTEQAETPIAYIGQCCMCGARLHIAGAEWHRELGCCGVCGLNARLRGIILAICYVIYGEMTVPLLRRPARKVVRMLGIADHDGYATVLADRFHYINTYYHREPSLDVCDPGACAHYASNDIVVCSDVIEHTVLRPLSVIRNLLSMLVPGGTLVLTAPTFDMDDTIEWYGGLRQYRIEPGDARQVLRWENIRGQTFLDDDPIFHGGAGATAELRLISHPALVAMAPWLGAVVRTMEFEPQWGYSWPLVQEFPYLEAAVDGRILMFRKDPLGRNH